MKYTPATMTRTQAGALVVLVVACTAIGMIVLAEAVGVAIYLLTRI